MSRTYYIPDLHIFVNRRKFEEGDGVRSGMTGRQIAVIGQRPGGERHCQSRVRSFPRRGGRRR